MIKNMENVSACCGVSAVERLTVHRSGVDGQVVWECSLCGRLWFTASPVDVSAVDARYAALLSKLGGRSQL